MKLIVTGFKKLLKGELSKFGKQKLLIRCTRPKSIALFIVGSWFFFMTLCLLFAVSLDKLDKVGQFGDFFGSLNTLFSGGALAGVILSLLLQRRELRLQRKEMKLTRKEMSGQKEVMEKQQKALSEQATISKQQRFESTFFSLFTHHHNTLKNLEVLGPSGHQVTGTEVIKLFKKEYQNAMSLNNSIGVKENVLQQATLDKFYFSPYAVSLNQLFNFVFLSGYDFETRQYYLSLIADSIHPREQLILYCYCGFTKDTELKNIIEEHQLLNQLEKYDETIKQLSIYNWFSSEAFGSASPIQQCGT